MKLATIILTGLNAGFFFAWCITVLPGTKTISDQAYLETMKAINKRIHNPVFFILFFGPVLLLTYQAMTGETLEILAILSYVLGPIMMTIFKNVPLNNSLEVKDLSSLSATEEREFRHLYEKKWNFWHYLRTLLSVVSFILVAL